MLSRSSRLLLRYQHHYGIINFVDAASSQRRFKSNDTSGAFTDRITIKAFGGNGGDGCISFSRGPNQEVAPPDGGNGGDGGDVYLQADTNCKSLRFSTTNLRAEHGGKGMSARRRGKDGIDTVIKVPQGTVISEIIEPMQAPPINENENQDQNETEDQNDEKKENILNKTTLSIDDFSDFKFHDNLDDDSDIKLILQQLQKNNKTSIKQDMKLKVIELNEHDQRIVLGKGGKGGKGNTAFKSSTSRTPMKNTPGTKGEIHKYELELKMIADIGLVGFPNAGKSTLLKSISNAKPRIASYPFTTLRPHIGVVNIDSTISFSLSIADIPGLIEGAHDNKGLGHDFLKHIERTSVLIYVVDISDGLQTARDHLKILQDELELYLPGLSNRVGCIVANKMDIKTTKQQDPNQRSTVNHTLLRFIDLEGGDVPIFPISAKYSVGVDELVQYLATCVLEKTRNDTNVLKENKGEEERQRALNLNLQEYNHT